MEDKDKILDEIFSNDPLGLLNRSEERRVGKD